MSTRPKFRFGSRRRADTIAQAGDANGFRAMFAAEEGAVLLEAVPDDADATVLAGRRQRMDRALEAVEGVGGAVHGHLKRLVVVVSTGFTSGHDNLTALAWFGGLEAITPPCRGRFRPFCGPMAALFAPGLAGCRIFTEKWAGKRALEREPFVSPPRLTPRTPERVRGATGAAGWVVKCPSSGLQLA